ncbi:hypothetical protein H6G41_20180 [Tolypothrix sp. FACHB-123]|uniref:hypothetical protein n=1 Tax=Tolypothrix sp. FACHB-123 TaxID=2692868 RepID=UPI0016835E64|nr:hypothetical protein [Tolypothrix sp. FACHB-123]MBD2356915.1 hypothetical protein [Tolypothrix sp. FACHB-123]
MLLEALFAAGTTVLREFVRCTAVEVIRHTVKVIRNWTNSRSKKESSNQHTSSSYSNKTAKDVTEEIEIVDAEVVELERKERRDGRIPQRDQERKQELELLRTDKFNEYQELKSEEIAEEQSASPENYETSNLGSDKVHILQFHMGQVVLDKKCSCGKSMILQSQKRLDGSLYQLSDFFWSCTGFYNNNLPLQCKKTKSFTAKDVGFLHKSDIFEFQVSNQQLSTIFHDTSVKKATISRIKSHLKEKDDEILCPVHHIPMILREKFNHSGVALDMFFLACPHTGCQQIVKLKSPAQLAAYLKRREGRGII